MKAWKVVLGLILIICAVLLILEALGVILPVTSVVGEIGFWQAVGGILLVSGIVSLISEGEFYGIFVLLGFLFMVFERNIAYICGIDGDDIINNWLVFGCSLLLTAGFMFLIPSRKKREKHKSTVKVNQMSGSEIYIDCAEFGSTEKEYTLNNKFGAIEVHFENVESYNGGGTLNIDSSFGAIEIQVPDNWKIDDNELVVMLGSLEIDDSEHASNGPTLKLKGRVSFGAVEVERE